MKWNKALYLCVCFCVYFVIVLLVQCYAEAKPLRLALSKGKGSESYEKYSKWLRHFDSTAEFIDLYHMDVSRAVSLIDSVDGLVLTGGPDVHPFYFGRPQDSAMCDIDAHRDTLEFKIIMAALNKKLPILAICRGEQMINVALGGDLIVDIPKYFSTKVIHKCEDSQHCYHYVNIDTASYLYSFLQIKRDTVTSNHHQAVGRPANDLKAVAWDDYGLIEALEWKHPDNRSFLIAVQWHPEKMDFNNPISSKTALRFLEVVKKQK